MNQAARAVPFCFDGTAFRAHPVGPTGRVATLLLHAVAVDALERRAQPALAPLGADRPLSPLPGWAVTHVLTMAAIEQRHPVPHLVLLEPDDAAPHRISLVARRRPPGSWSAGRRTSRSGPTTSDDADGSGSWSNSPSVRLSTLCIATR